jgi:hypothetical protein
VELFLLLVHSYPALGNMNIPLIMYQRLHASTELDILESSYHMSSSRPYLISSSSVVLVLEVVLDLEAHGKHTFDFVFANIDECRRLHHVASEVEHHRQL